MTFWSQSMSEPVPTAGPVASHRVTGRESLELVSRVAN